MKRPPAEIIRRVVYDVVRYQWVHEASGASYVRPVVVGTCDQAHHARRLLEEHQRAQGGADGRPS